MNEKFEGLFLSDAINIARKYSLSLSLGFSRLERERKKKGGRSQIKEIANMFHYLVFSGINTFVILISLYIE